MANGKNPVSQKSANQSFPLNLQTYTNICYIKNKTTKNKR